MQYSLPHSLPDRIISELRPRLHEQIKPPLIAQILDPYEFSVSSKRRRSSGFKGLKVGRSQSER